MGQRQAPTVVLVNPVIPYAKNWNIRENFRRPVRRFYPPINLLRLGGALKENGFAVRLLDCALEPRPFETLSRWCDTENVVCVGFTVKMAPLATSAQLLSHHVKRNHPEVAVVWGGVLPTLLPEMVLRETYADYVVVGEGEEALVALCHSLVAKTSPAGIAGLGWIEDDGTMRGRHAQNPRAHQTREYLMDLSIIGDKLTFEQRPYIASTVATEGCPYDCAFCYLSALDETLDGFKKWRPRSQAAVLAEIDAFRSYGMNVVTFSDDNFLLGHKRVLPLIDALAERQVYIEDCISSIGTITPAVVERIAPMIQQISYSIETVNPELQAIIRKKQPRDKVLATNRLLFDHGINSVHNFIVGIPRETDDDLRLNVELAAELRRINPFVRFTAIYCIPEPQSALETWVRETLGLRVPWRLSYVGLADMSGLQINPALHPWISRAEDQEFYNDFMVVFDALFSRWQHKNDPRIDALLGKPRLARIFEPALSLPDPPDYIPYILDRLVRDPAMPYPQGKVDIRALAGGATPRRARA